MSEILSTLITPQVKATFTVILIVIVLLYLLSIVWVVRDAYLRGASPVIWGIVAIIPFLGCMIYAMLRPPLYASDQEEQNIGLLLQQRELMAYGECPKCGYPTERDYVVCPNCHMHLKNTCVSCGHTLEPEWTICPYCTTKVGRPGQRPQNAARVPAQQRPANQAALRQGNAAALPPKQSGSQHAAAQANGAPKASGAHRASAPAHGSASHGAQPSAAQQQMARPAAQQQTARPTAQQQMGRPVTAQASQVKATSQGVRSASATSARPAVSRAAQSRPSSARTTGTPRSTQAPQSGQGGTSRV